MSLTWRTPLCSAQLPPPARPSRRRLRPERAGERPAAGTAPPARLLQPRCAHAAPARAPLRAPPHLVLLVHPPRASSAPLVPPLPPQ